jgi:dipeptidyl aminopeptidase/acylaminoacyl peptidase
VTTAGPRTSTLRDRISGWFEVSSSHLPSFSHDGREILYVSDSSGLPQAWRVAASGGTPRRLQESRERIGQVDACPTRPRAILSQDAGGNEVWQLELLTLDDGIGRMRERRRPLTADSKVMNLAGLWTSDGHSYLFSSNARNHRYFDVYRINVDGWSPPERIWTGDAWQQVAATAGDRTVVHRFNTFLDVDLYLLDGARSPLHLNAHTEEVSVSSVAIASDGVYVATNPGREMLSLLRYPFDGGAPEVVAEYGAEVELVRASPDGRRLVISVNRDGRSELRVRETESGRERVLPIRPRGVVYGVSWRPDGSGFAFDLSWPNGHEVFVYDLESRRTLQLTRSSAAPPRRVPEPRLGWVRATDGLRVPYWEYSPRSRRPRGTIITVHGGPEGQSRPEFDPEVGGLVSEGWRVVLPNVRGSTGYGRTYLHRDDVRLRMDSVRDVRDLVTSLVRSRRAAPGRLGILGGSYGGFMVLSSISTYPDLWGAAVELFGISNFVTFLERTADWRRSLREAEYGSLAHDREFLESISPIGHLDAIRAPLFVFHGRNDPRVPIHEAEQIVEALRRSGRTVESRYFENEGHGFAHRENRVETAVRAIDFFSRHLDPPGPRRARSPRRK